MTALLISLIAMFVKIFSNNLMHIFAVFMTQLYSFLMMKVRICMGFKVTLNSEAS